MDLKRVLERAKTKRETAKATYTIDADIFEAFQKACEKEDVAQSRIVEELMKEFLDYLKNK